MIPVTQENSAIRSGGVKPRFHNRFTRRHGGAAVPVVAISTAAVTAYLAEDWIAGLGILVLWMIWRILWRANEPPVLPLALSFQWLQVTCGIYYYLLTGREVEAFYLSDYRTMVLMGLGCVAALTAGVAVGVRAGGLDGETTKRRFAVTWRTLVLAYLGTSLANALFNEVAWSVPGLTQGILALTYLRLGVIFLMFRRLIVSGARWDLFGGLLALELLLGFTGYFAGFREPLVLAALALLETFKHRSAGHWVRLSALVTLMAVASVVWMGIRTSLRAEIDSGGLSTSRTERLERVTQLSAQFLSDEIDLIVEDVDELIERLWAIYYPALAVMRVPEVLPHENGAIMWAALKHLTMPRILFPEKEILASDSELVRKYSGVLVAGPEQNTSIAFGYAAESYVDFGIPLMFVPSLIFGLFMGSAYRMSYKWIRNRELADGLVCVVFWLSLYLFERSWIKTLGLAATLLLYVGGLVLVLDRRLTMTQSKSQGRFSVSRRRLSGAERRGVGVR